MASALCNRNASVSSTSRRRRVLRRRGVAPFCQSQKQRHYSTLVALTVWVLIPISMWTGLATLIKSLT